jgi:hypothetical protein
MITRQSAESLLRQHHPVIDGLFLVRKSSRDKGFVLSVIQVGEMVGDTSPAPPLGCASCPSPSSPRRWHVARSASWPSLSALRVGGTLAARLWVCGCVGAWVCVCVCVCVPLVRRSRRLVCRGSDLACTWLHVSVTCSACSACSGVGVRARVR